MGSAILSLVQKWVEKGRSLATNEATELKICCTDKVYPVTVFTETLQIIRTEIMSPTHSKSKQAALFLIKDFVL